MDTKNQAAICDPGRPPQAAALGPLYANPTGTSPLSPVATKICSRERAMHEVKDGSRKGSRAEGPCRVESAADVLSSLTRVISAIERDGGDPPVAPAFLLPSLTSCIALQVRGKEGCKGKLRSWFPLEKNKNQTFSEAEINNCSAPMATESVGSTRWSP